MVKFLPFGDVNTVKRIFPMICLLAPFILHSRVLRHFMNE